MYFVKTILEKLQTAVVKSFVIICNNKKLVCNNKKLFKKPFTKSLLNHTHVFLWDLRPADRLSTNEHMHLRDYTTEFLHGGERNT